MPSRRERRQKNRRARGRAAQPARAPHALQASWRAVEHVGGRTRFVGVRRWWRWRRGEWGDWGMIYGIGTVFVLPISLALILDGLDFGDERIWVTWWELLLGVVFFLGWLGGPLVAGLRPDIVWEARPGHLAIGRRNWQIAELAGLELTLGSGADVHLLTSDGERLHLARFRGGQATVREALQRLAATAGLPLQLHR